MQQREVAQQRRDGPTRAPRDADRGRHQPVDAREPPVGEHPRRRVADRREVEVADRVGRADQEHVVGPERGQHHLRHLRPGELRPSGEQPVEPPPRPVLGRAPALEPGLFRRPGLRQHHVVDDVRRGTPGVGPVGVRGGDDELDVGAGEQPADRAREGRVADDDDPLDLGGQVGEQEAVGAERRRPGAGVARGLAQQGHSGGRRPSGPGPAERRRRVAHDDDGPRAPLEHEGRGRVDRVDVGQHDLRQRDRGEGRVGHERVVELHVEVHRPGEAAPRARRRGQEPSDLVRDRLGVGDRRRRPYVGGEQTLLLGRLVGPGPAERGRAVGAHHDQGNVAVPRLEDGGVQVGDGGARRRDDRDRTPRRLGQAEREEAGPALVHPHVQPQGAVAVRRPQHQRERGAPGARREHDLADATREQRRDEGPGERRRVRHGTPPCPRRAGHACGSAARARTPRPRGPSARPPGAPRRPRPDGPAACRRPGAAAR